MYTERIGIANLKVAQPCLAGMDREAIFFTGRGAARSKIYGAGRGGEPPPPPHSAGRGGARAKNILRVSAD